MFTQVFGADVQAATYYVSSGGNDSNVGTNENQSFKTIQKGVNTARAGDTVYVRAGTYSERVTVSQSGIANQPITISGYHNERPVIDGRKSLPGDEWSGLVSISGNYIIFNNFEVKNSSGMGIGVNGNNNRVQNCSVHHSFNNGVLVYGSANNNIVEDSEIWSNCMDNENGQRGHWASGVSAARSPSNTTFRRNKIYNNWGEALSAFEINQGVIMEDNIVYDNYAVNVYIDNAPHVIVRRNLIYNTGDSRFSRAPGIAFCDEKALSNGTHDVQIINNMILGGNRSFYHWKQSGSNGLINWVIANNTFVNSDKEAVFQIAAGSHRNSRIENNLFIQDNNLPMVVIPNDSELKFSYNLWSKNPNNSLAMGTNSLVADPKITKTGVNQPDRLTPDWFKITADSPAINKGKIISEVLEDYFQNARGNTPDIGAHEYGGSIPTFTQTPPTPTPTRISPTPTRPQPAITSSPTPTPTTPVAICQKDLGDANCDGLINQVDFDCLKAAIQHRSSPSGCVSADFNNDTKVSLIDFEIWRRHRIN